MLFLYRHLLRNKLIPKTIKLELYKAIIRPVVTYGCETWILTPKDINNFKIFEREILRKIYEPIQVDSYEE